MVEPTSFMRIFFGRNASLLENSSYMRDFSSSWDAFWDAVTARRRVRKVLGWSRSSTRTGIRLVTMHY